jgi:hypothetical protein
MGNPILFIDPSGRLACQYGMFLVEDSFACGQQIAQSYKGIDALIQLFLNPALDKYNDGVLKDRARNPIMITGDSARDRLGWIITLTSNRFGTIRGGLQGNDSVMIGQQGLLSDFVIGSDDQQLSKHFMQGVRFGYPLYLLGITGVFDGEEAIRLMISHELDTGMLGEGGVTDNDVKWFRAALACDYSGRLGGGWESRNQWLHEIFRAHNTPSTGGRSEQDLRMWLKGYRFGKAVDTGRDSLDGKTGQAIVTRQQAVMWLQANIQDRTWLLGGQ